jgi:hypothetical protein
VASLWNEFEASIGQRLGVGTTIVRVYDAIALAPDDEGRNPHATKSAAQLRIVHALLPPVHPKRLEVRCHRLTPAGEALLSKGRTVVNEVLSESFSPLSPMELETLYDLLTRLLPEMKAENLSGTLHEG